MKDTTDNPRAMFWNFFKYMLAFMSVWISGVAFVDLVWQPEARAWSMIAGYFLFVIANKFAFWMADK